MKRIALVGMPNTGKSTFFNRVTGASARVGNWPGITVDLFASKILLGADMVEIVDLPGIYDLHGFSDDERIVRHFLEDAAVDLVAVVINAAQIDRQLAPRACRLRHSACRRRCCSTWPTRRSSAASASTPRALARELGAPVALLSAKHGHGQREAMAMLARALASASPVPHGAVRAQLAADDRIDVDAAAVLSAAVDIPERMSEQLTDRIDRVLLHPLLGLPLFFLLMLLVFEGVFSLGEPLQRALQWAFDVVRASGAGPAARAGAGARPRLAARRRLVGRRHGRGVRAADHPVLPVHGGGRGLGLPVARGVPHRRADGEARSRRAQLRDDADGLRLQRPGGDGHADHALARTAPADDDDHPGVAVLGAAAGVPVPRRGDLRAAHRRRWSSSRST